MAAFTALALAGAAAGGFLASKLKKKKAPTPSTVTPGTETLTATAPPEAPVTTAQTVAATNDAAQRAAIKTRKRAAQGSLLTRPKSLSSRPMATPSLVSKSLSGR